MSYTPVGWANDETHPLSQANMKTLDQGIADAHALAWQRLAQIAPSGTTADLDVPVAWRGVFHSFEVRGFVSHVGAATRELRMQLNGHGGNSYRTHVRRTAMDGTVTDFGGDELTAGRVGHTRFLASVRIGIEWIDGEGYVWECNGGFHTGSLNSLFGTTKGAGRLSAVTSQLTQVRLLWQGDESFAANRRLTLWGIPA